MKNAILFLFIAASFYAKAQSFTSVVVADSIEAVLVRHVEDSILSDEYVTINIHEAFYYTDNNIYVSLGAVPGNYIMSVSHAAVPLVAKPTTSECTRAWTIFEMVNWLRGNVGNAYESYSITGSGTVTATVTINATNYTGTGTTNVDAFGDAFYEFINSFEFLTLLIN